MTFYFIPVTQKVQEWSSFECLRLHFVHPQVCYVCLDVCCLLLLCWSWLLCACLFSLEQLPLGSIIICLTWTQTMTWLRLTVFSTKPPKNVHDLVDGHRCSVMCLFEYELLWSFCCSSETFWLPSSSNCPSLGRLVVMGSFPWWWWKGGGWMKTGPGDTAGMTTAHEGSPAGAPVILCVAV